MKDFTHLDEKHQPKMVDVSEKKISQRTAIAQSIVVLPDEVFAEIFRGRYSYEKRFCISTAIIAGIMARKKNRRVDPLCHPLDLENCAINIQLQNENELVIECTASITAKTGVEMEALVGASIAALTVYDMCKALSHDIVIKETKLLQKNRRQK